MALEITSAMQAELQTYLIAASQSHKKEIQKLEVFLVQSWHYKNSQSRHTPQVLQQG